MDSTLRQRNRLIVVTAPPRSRQKSFNDRIAAIAELGAGTLAAERCSIAVRSSAAGIDEVVSAPRGDSPSDALLNATLRALDNRLADAAATDGSKRARDARGSIRSIGRVALSGREIDAIAPVEKTGDGLRLAATAFSSGAGSVRIAMVSRADRARDELEASLELMARAVFSEIAAAAARASLEFWRLHGADSGREAAAGKRELRRLRAAANRLDEAEVAARSWRPAERFACFGELVASGAGFDQWVVAVADGGALAVVASSSGGKQFDPGQADSALGKSFRRRIVIARGRDRDSSAAAGAGQYSEDKIFSGAYVCIPFEAGAITLASRDERASSVQAEAFVRRLAPLAAIWVMELEAARRRGLMRQLALRIFAAVDEERARIARDLHDDQAQLLAAAKIALEGGGRVAARAILKQVEEELRRKTRELRPATLGNASLDDAIEREFARLNRAGVKARLIDAGVAEKISRPVQQLCFQVVREALSNVIRHARAKSVEVAIERIDTAARVSISDDGRGIDLKNGDGVGLAGLRERLELMGGRLTVESRAGRTTVVAEVPESA